MRAELTEFLTISKLFDLEEHAELMQAISLKELKIFLKK